jgi:hypothetical protein
LLAILDTSPLLRLVPKTTRSRWPVFKKPYRRKVDTAAVLVAIDGEGSDARLAVRRFFPLFPELPISVPKCAA